MSSTSLGCALSALFVLTLSAPAAPQGILRVDRDASGAGTGANWTDAIPDLQQALTMAREFQLSSNWSIHLWVAEGTYAPAGPGGPRTASFVLPRYVAMFGGFAGTEDAFLQRDAAAHPTILTGDLMGDDQPGGVNRSDNAYHVLTAPDVFPSTFIESFTVQGGQADGSDGGHDVGGGLWAQNGSPVVQNCTFVENQALSGGAIAVGTNYYAWPTAILGCTFTDNRALAGCGGALHVLDVGWLEAEDCRFEGNQATGVEPARGGGAIFVAAGARGHVSASRFLGNADHTTGGLGRGGALCNLADDLRVESCTFAGNSAAAGGAVWDAGSITLTQSVFSANTADLGGGLLLDAAGATLASCTFSGNVAVDGGGVASLGGPPVQVSNCILWGNVANGLPLVRQQWHDLLGASSQFGWCTIQGLFDAIPGEDPPAPADFPGCLAADPLLLDPAGPDGVPGTDDDDLSLAAGSPARDAGNNGLVTPGLLEDLAGATRFHDDPLAPDTGVGTPPLVDLGALEGDAPIVWVVLGGASPSEEGLAELRGTGPLTPGSAGALVIKHHYGGNEAILFISTSLGTYPSKYGLFVAWPPDFIASWWVSSGGDKTFGWDAWPAGASGLTISFQFAVFDPVASWNYLLTNGLVALPQ